MSRYSTTIFVALSLLTFIGVPISADSANDYWPTWRGPDGTGTSPQGNPPATWSETENIKWKVKVPGEGTSSPIIWQDKMFFQTAALVEKTTPASSSGNSSETEPRPVP